MSNILNIDMPEAGQSKTYALALDDSATLNLNPKDIQAVALGNDGELIIELTNGGQINLINFEQFNNSGQFIYLADNSLLNFSALTAPPSQDILHTNLDSSVCEIDPALLSQINEDGDLVVTLTDGEEITIAEAMTVEDSIGENVALTTTLDIARDVANLEPAAGEPDLNLIAQELANLNPEAGDGALGGNTGFGFSSNFTVTNFDAVDDVGPLGPTQLSYNAPEFIIERLLLPIDAPDGQPSLVIENAIVDETNFSNGRLRTEGNIIADFGADGAGRIEGNNNFNASSPFGDLALTSGGRPVTVTFDAATNSYIGTFENNSAVAPLAFAATTRFASFAVPEITTVFTLTIDPQTGDYVYTQFEPLDHPDATDPDDPLFLDFGVAVLDRDGDAANGTVRVTVQDDGPQIGNIARAIDESDFGWEDQISVKGTVPHDFGEDGAGAITANGNFQFIPQFGGPAEQLTSGGRPVTVTTTNDGYVGKIGNQIVFTLDINPKNGDFIFTQFEALDHPDAHDPDDIIWLKFYVDIVDFDGDKDTGTIIIDVRDDGPTIKNVAVGIDETNLDGKNQISVHGNVHFDFGADDKGATIQPNGKFSFLTEVEGYSGQLTSGGHPVHVTKTSDGYVGTVGNRIIFDLSVTPTTGKFTFTQFDTLDHPDVHDANDVIWLKFGVTAIDGDGDKNTGTIIIDVRDDGPKAVNDHASISKNQSRTSGNVLNNDDFGADGAGQVLNSGIFYGKFGTLHLNTDGSFHYVRNGVTGGTDVFKYTIQDADGDKDVAALKIDVVANPPPPPPPPPPIFQGDGGDGGTPLVLDLDGDGIELTTREDGVLFDIDLDGIADQTAWVQADDALLALDRNGDGIINDRGELFGDTDGFDDGFQNLASLDSNNDGKIDAQDALFADLIVWQDLNQDGISDDNEMISLSEAGIVDISLNVTKPDDLYIAGNWISDVSTFTTVDGTTRSIVDAWFKYTSGTALEDNPGRNIISIRDSFDIATMNIENIQGNGVFKVEEFNDNNILTHNGEEINVTFDKDTNIYFGATGDKLIFNIQVEENGDYQFNLFDSIDQALSGDFHETITLQFGVSNNNNADENGFINIDVKGMGYHFANASSNDSIDVNTLLEGHDNISASLDQFVESTTTEEKIEEIINQPLANFNASARLNEISNQQSDVI